MKEFDVRPLKGGFCPWPLWRREPSVNVAKRTNQIRLNVFTTGKKL